MENNFAWECQNQNCAANKAIIFSKPGGNGYLDCEYCNCVMKKLYREFNNTCYSINCPDNLITILDSLLEPRRTIRVKIHYGDVKTRQPWGDTESGYIGRSNGSCKIPLLVYNSRSTGGGGILTDHIIKIEYARRKAGGIIYELKSPIE